MNRTMRVRVPDQSVAVRGVLPRVSDAPANAEPFDCYVVEHDAALDTVLIWWDGDEWVQVPKVAGSCPTCGQPRTS